MKITSLTKALGVLSLVFAVAYSFADNVDRTLPIDVFANAAVHGNCINEQHLSLTQPSLIALDTQCDNFREDIHHRDGTLCEIDYIFKKYHNSSGQFQVTGNTTATLHQLFNVADAQPASALPTTHFDIQQAILKIDRPIKQLPILIDHKSIAWLDQYDHHLLKIAHHSAWQLAIAI